MHLRAESLSLLIICSRAAMLEGVVCLHQCTAPSRSSALCSDAVPGVLEEAAGPAGVRVGPGGLRGGAAAAAASAGVRDQMHQPQVEPHHSGVCVPMKSSHNVVMSVGLCRLRCPLAFFTLGRQRPLIVKQKLLKGAEDDRFIKNFIAIKS